MSSCSTWTVACLTSKEGSWLAWLWWSTQMSLVLSCSPYVDPIPEKENVTLEMYCVILPTNSY